MPIYSSLLRTFCYAISASLTWRIHTRVWFLRLQWFISRKYFGSRRWCCCFYCRKEYCHVGLWWGFYDIVDEQNKIFRGQKVELPHNLKRMLDRHGNWKLTLNAPITTKVVCFSRLLKCLRGLFGKQCGPRSDCSYEQSVLDPRCLPLYLIRQQC